MSYESLVSSFEVAVSSLEVRLSSGPDRLPTVILDSTRYHCLFWSVKRLRPNIYNNYGYSPPRLFEIACVHVARERLMSPCRIVARVEFTYILLLKRISCVFLYTNTRERFLARMALHTRRLGIYETRS